MRTVHAFTDDARLPGGRRFNPRRRRSAGVLDAEEIAWCRAQGIALAADPVQLGWVVAGCEDDIDEPGLALRPGLPAPAALRLRPWAADDLPAFRALLDDPRVWRFLPERYPDPLTDGMAAELLALANAAPHHEVRAIEADGVPVGQVRLAFAPRGEGPGVAEVSYWLGTAHWGRGLAAAALGRWAQDCLGRHPGIESLIARIHRDNLASARVAGRAGFRAEGPAADDPAIAVWRLSRG
ncbi:MAG: GNAT family N-acetyltransferase [Rhodobacteraceae bacterium]|jgi:RimJ/RimL family protein N-acetyltransferase|nr:GNAT family N-acetyltransferase [Paracoccaceae bacterium]